MSTNRLNSAPFAAERVYAGGAVLQHAEVTKGKVVGDGIFRSVAAERLRDVHRRQPVGRAPVGPPEILRQAMDMDVHRADEERGIDVPETEIHSVLRSNHPPQKKEEPLHAAPAFVVGQDVRGAPAFAFLEGAKLANLSCEPPYRFAKAQIVGLRGHSAPSCETAKPLFSERPRERRSERALSLLERPCPVEEPRHIVSLKNAMAKAGKLSAQHGQVFGGLRRKAPESLQDLLHLSTDDHDRPEGHRRREERDQLLIERFTEAVNVADGIGSDAGFAVAGTMSSLERAPHLRLQEIRLHHPQDSRRRRSRLSSRGAMAEPDRLKPLDAFTLADLESIRLVLRGDSVIDWRRLNFDGPEEVAEFLVSQEFDPESPEDDARMDSIKSEAIAYLRRHFNFPIPRPIETASVADLLLVASSKGHRQMCACTILKCMHIIHHLEGRELLFNLPLSDQQVFQLVEEKVYRVIGKMLAGGFPIAEFVGGRKAKDSLYTKLLSKQETVAAQIYDKLRFRIVTRHFEDILPVIHYLSRHLFPFNYAIPGESINSMLNFGEFCRNRPHLRPMLQEMQIGRDADLTPSDNRFSADSYRVIHFVVDMPVRLPDRILSRSPRGAETLGNIVFVICEFQVIDQETEAQNEVGEASHANYKERQKRAVMRRLQLGIESVPPPKAAPRVPTPPPPPKAVSPRGAGAKRGRNKR